MARPYSNPQLISEALVLYVQGGSPKTIHTFLSRNAAAPSLRTVNNWISKFRLVQERLLRPDNPYEWHLKESDSFSIEDRNLIYRMLRIKKNPTNREVYWWLKISAIRQDMSDDDLISISQQCVLNQHKELLGIGEIDWDKAWDRINERVIEPFPIKYSLLSGKYMISYLEVGQQIPDWVVGDELLAITQTFENIMVVSEHINSEQMSIPSNIQVETGWHCIRILSGNLAFLPDLEQHGVDYQVLSSKDCHYILFRNVSVEFIQTKVLKGGIRLHEER